MMQRFLKYLKNRPRIIFTLAIILPGVFVSIFEYILTDGISGEKPILAALAGCVLAAILLMFVKPDETSKKSEKGQPSDIQKKREAFLKNFEHEVSKVVQEPATPETSTPSSPPDSPTEERIFSPRTPVELVDEIKGMTGVVAKRVSERHIGQWLKVTGPVKDVSNKGDEIFVYISKTEPSMLLYFDASRWGKSLASYNVGDQISVIGQIEYISRGGSVRLEKCELVS